MKIFFMLALTILFFCMSTESRLDNLNFYTDNFIKVETDSPATISWGYSQDVKKYLLYCRYDHEDTSWFIIDSIFRGDSSYNNSSYIIPREAVTEKLFHSCKGDSLFFLILQSINDDNTYENNIRFFIDSEVCYANWILWKSRIVPLRPFPTRVRWFQ